MSGSAVTRWWWLRHAPVVGQEGRLTGGLDVDCDCSDTARLRALAARLPAEAVWVVSPLKRTRQTAEALARHLAKKPGELLVEPTLAEQDFGAWQGQSYAELAATQAAAWERFWQEPADATPPGGESFAAVVRRVAESIEALTRHHAGRHIVCVSHGGTIRAALAHALGVQPAQALSFAVECCSLTRLDHIAGTGEGRGERSGSWRITTVNDVGDRTIA